MKAAIYNPYFDTLGGGEKYTISFANVLAHNGYDVDLQWHDMSILNKLSVRFGIKLSQKIRVIENIRQGRDYDVCFWVSDGSMPTLGARRNFIHFQVPFKNVNGNSLFNKMKLFRIEKVICNSDFTKNVIDDEYSINSEVIYPPISIQDFKPKRKKDIILYVGRFSQLNQSKKQDILVDAFLNLLDNPSYSDWKLVLAGGVEVGTGEEFKKLKMKASESKQIEIIESPSFEKLKDIYGTAKIFWSAAGYGEDKDVSPNKFEHFGMTVVESMSAGCVPVVFNGGGFPEIVDGGESGFLWHNTEMLVRQTKSLIDDKKQLYAMSKNAVQKSKMFSEELFEERIKNLLK